ncbi:3-ketoacyl-CoA thiolase, peroxisomal-like [Plectropomus leopardus]|uniref:3-ketoacyl-CoA thiolase, peroxisomal-like n=1 Tax=Plectropomus leopardus TaxID=160734 RepID=UPI001C4D65F2|nr:3-ketoacyl-CoA thiolase, peroxisomal-like [Plectropomus leopardus]
MTAAVSPPRSPSCSDSRSLSGHLSPAGASGAPQRDLRSPHCRAESSDSPQDVVVVHGGRGGGGESFRRGGFKDTTPDELLSAVMTAVLRDVHLSTHTLGDICVGNVLQPGAGAVMARVAHFLSGFPETVPVYTVNRQCSSGLQALFNIAGAIRSGSIDLGLACGVESMSLRAMGDPGDLSHRVSDNDKARDCMIPMGITSENVAEKFGISREKQDAFALSSHQKAARAQSSGVFEQEIVPITARTVDEQGRERQVTVSQDEGIRAGTTLEGLAKLRPAFKPDGSTTAGNSSQVSDGAAAVLVGRRSAVEALGLPILGVLRASAVVGVPPDLMGIGPAFAIPAALEQAGKIRTGMNLLTQPQSSAVGMFCRVRCEDSPLQPRRSRSAGPDPPVPIRRTEAGQSQLSAARSVSFPGSDPQLRPAAQTRLTSGSSGSQDLISDLQLISSPLTLPVSAFKVKVLLHTSKFLCRSQKSQRRSDDDIRPQSSGSSH